MTGKPAKPAPAGATHGYLRSPDGALLTLLLPSTSIGREGCDLNLAHGGVSTRHATIWLDGETAWIQDEGSRNKTFVNETELAPRTRHRIVPGDVIQISRSQAIRFTFFERPENEAPDLLDVLGMLNAFLNEQELLDHLLHLAVRLLHADRGFVVPLELMESSRGKPLASWPAIDKETETLAELGVVEEPLRSALTSAQTVLQNYWTPESGPRERATSVLVVPVILRESQRSEGEKRRTALQKEKLLCALYLECRSREASFGAADKRVVQMLADQVAVAVEARRRGAVESEVLAAARIQRQVLPSHFDRWAHFEIHARNVPATEMSGDFYEFVELSPDRLGIAVGDVSGHGLPAAVLMTAMMSSVWNSARNAGAPAAVLRSINDYASLRTPPGKFATLLYGELHSSGLFTWVSAGHPPPLVVRASGSVESFPETFSVFPIGLFDSDQWPPGEPKEVWTRLDEGDFVVIVTDGVLEASGPTGLFGDHLAAVAGESQAGTTARDLVGRIVEALRRHTGKDAFEDDVTLVAFRYQGAFEDPPT